MKHYTIIISTYLIMIVPLIIWFRLKPKDEFEKEKFELLNKDLRRRHAQLNEMEESLPKKSGSYLKIILGSVNVSFLNKQERQVYQMYTFSIAAVS